MTEPNHPVAAMEEGIINPSGVVEPFVAPAQRLVFLDIEPQSDTDPEPDGADDETFHSTTTQPKALLGFIMHGGPSDEDSIATTDDDTLDDPPPLQQREDILSDDDSDDDETISVTSSPKITPRTKHIDGNDNAPWVQGTNGKTRRRLHNEDGSYTLPPKVATTYGLCQSALTWMSLKDDAGQL
jgi:hypothetical protein